MVRIWCVPVELLDRQHLLGEHVELHIIFNAIARAQVGIKAGWQKHPQTLRFSNNLGMLVSRHSEQVEEMNRRGYKHNSPLPIKGGEMYQSFSITTFLFDTDFVPILDVKPEPYVYSDKQMLDDIKTLQERGVDL